MKHFNIAYHNSTIAIEEKDGYTLTFPDGRWISTRQEEDYSKVIASSDADTRQQIPSEWVFIATSGGPDWINREQLQVLGELINRKKKEQDTATVHPDA